MTIDSDYPEPLGFPPDPPRDPDLPPGDEWVKEFQDTMKPVIDKIGTVDDSADPWFDLSPTGLYVRRSATAEEMESLLWEFGVTHRSIHFWIGDALLYCEARFGDKWSQYVPDLPVYALKTMQNDMWVCRAIEPSRRREKLSFGHHAVVAAQEPELQDNFLSMAEELNLSVSSLSHMVTVSGRGAMPKPISLARALKADLRLRVEHLYEGLTRIAELPDPTGLIALEIDKLETPPRALRPDVVYRAWIRANDKLNYQTQGILEAQKTVTQIARFEAWLDDWANSMERK